MLKNRKLIIIGVVLLLGLAGLGYAWHTFMSSSSSADQSHQSQSAVVKPAAVTKLQKFHHVCPQADTLVSKDHKWRAPGGWKSYTTSFSDEIQGFIGAQWIGVRVGKIICLYQGTTSDTFHISLERDNLVRSPEGFRWGKNLGGYKNCRSIRVKDCPFIMAAPVNEKMDREGIYKNLYKKE